MQLSCTMSDVPDPPIRRWKRQHGLTYPQVAKLLGIEEDYARKLGCGSVKRTSAQLAEQIEQRSGGEIRKEEMVFGEDAA